MPGMRRADRRDSNSDNERNNPRSRQPEPPSYTLHGYNLHFLLKDNNIV